MKHKDKVLILTPVKDAKRFLDRYFESLYRLTYPRDQISIGFLESDSQDQTYRGLQERIPEINRAFRSAALWKKDFGFHTPSGTPRWTNHLQLERRAVLARSRNHLLFHALDDEDWVLWLDVDVIEYPSDIIEKLLKTGKLIVQPHCVQEFGGRSFDLNAWRNKGKYHLHDLRQEGDLVRLHAVGGTMLLVRTDIHRDGLIFPSFLYGKRNPLIRKHNLFFSVRKWDLLRFRSIRNSLQRKSLGEIETKALDMMAHDMGHECWGIPNLEIRHIKL